MEQSLIDGGMPVEEVQRLCEVHVQVFENSLAKGGKPNEMAGHPVHTLLEENKLAWKKAGRLQAAAWAWTLGLGSAETAKASLDDLSALIIHYTRKENQLFPYLERQGFTGPSRVMWGKHDEIRALFKEAREALDGPSRGFLGLARRLGGKIRRMIFMEEHILIPEAVRRLSDREWAEIRQGEEAIGFAAPPLSPKPGGYRPQRPELPSPEIGRYREQDPRLIQEQGKGQGEILDRDGRPLHPYRVLRLV